MKLRNHCIQSLTLIVGYFGVQIRWIVFVLMLCGLGPVFAGPALPLKASNDAHYLVDQNGAPVLLQIDSPWSLFVALTDEEVDQYLDNRKAKGFNVLIANLVEHLFGGADNTFGAPTNRYGDAPFTTPGDFSTPNEKYFQHADWVIDRAAAKGFVLLLNPCYLGYPNESEGWYNEVMATTIAACADYGRFIGNRYRSRTNIVWTMCGDRNPGDALSRVDAMAGGISEFVPNNLFTAHCIRTYSSISQFSSSPWLSLNSIYPRPDTLVSECLAGYAESPSMPAIMVEAWYENEHAMTDQGLRAQAYQALLSGMCGQAFGNTPLWAFDLGWQQALDSNAGQQMKYASDLLLSRRWNRLKPDVDHSVVPSGYASGTNYLSSARTSDGDTVIAYSPSGATIKIEMSSLSGADARAWWYDVRTGVATLIGNFPVAAGVVAFDPPSSEDWTLVLDRADAGFVTPGATVPPVALDGPDAMNLGLGLAVSQQLSATGGFGNYQWSLAPDSAPLPDGLTLSPSGLLAGTVPIVGDYTVKLMVFDGTTSPATRTITLSVVPAVADLTVAPQTPEELSQLGFHFHFTSNVPGSFRIDLSTGFGPWLELTNFLFESGTVDIVDTNPVAPVTRIYRAVSQ